MREARYDENAMLDEVVANDVESFHLEQLHGGAWWIGITHKDGTETHINLFSRSGRALIDARCDFDA